MYKPVILPVLGLMLGVLSPCTIAEPESAEALPQAPAMTNLRLHELIKRIDAKADGAPGYWEFSVEGQRIRVITDASADRMRIIAPIAKSDELDKAQLYRLMQANFDSALDARYSVAKGVLWSAFIHPLSSLSDKEFLTGVGQVVNLVATYGSSYSSGALIYKGGDSHSIERRNVIDQLLKKGLEI